MYNYETENVCASNIEFEIKDGRVYGVKFRGGCNGNTKAVAALVEGLPVGEVIKKLRGIECGFRGTSCGDQLAIALEGIST